MKRCLLLAILLAATGCRATMTPGNAYRTSGHYLDLLAEPTLDIGGYMPGEKIYEVNVPHFDVDGHHVFDVPIVAFEQLFFIPAWVLNSALRLSGTEPDMWAPWPPTEEIIQNPGAGMVVARKTIAWSLALPGRSLLGIGIVTTMVFDTAVHDVPVIIVGLPFRALTAVVGPPY
jgi:hypothetical protein